MRAAEIAKLAMPVDVPWLLEQPAQQSQRPHMFLLPEFVKLISTEGVKLHDLDQCQLGCEFKKPTQVLGTAGFTSAFKCDHPKVWFREIPSGRWIYASHPPLAGRIKAVPQHEWKDSFYDWRPRAGQPYLTKSTANYPGDMNRALAVDLVNAAISFTTNR